MRDLWKYVAFPVAAVTGYLASITTVSAIVEGFTGLPEFPSNLLVVAVSGLISGFLIDELIPAYLKHIRSGSSGGGDLGGGGDFGEGDMDFGN